MSATLTYSQIEPLVDSLALDIRRELLEDHPTFNHYELNEFIYKVVRIKVRAILVTLTDTPYEDITKVVHDKLNLSDLFDNRQKYLN